MTIWKPMAWTIVALACAGNAAPSHAWGPNGHAIVADIANSHLSAPARQQVGQLLASESKTSIDEISSWADDYRPTHPETAPWHFVDIPLNARAFDENRDCGGGNCVVDKIVAFSQVLGNKAAPIADRAQALNFIVHFVGDVHQPLHSENNGDRGGNDIKISFYGKAKNLHSVWDDGIIEHATGLHTLMPGYRIDRGAAQAVAKTLNAAIKPDVAAIWAPPHFAGNLHAAAEQWANESHLLAQAAYKARAGNTSLDDDYQNQEWPVVQGQLERGGIRLAELLNEILQ